MTNYEKTKNKLSRKKDSLKKINNYTNKNYRIYLILLLVVLCVSVYYPSLDFSFTNWDDETVLLNNISVTSLSPGNILNIFQSFTNNHYQPLVIITYAIEYKISEFNPFLYHLDNLIFYALTVIFVFLFISKLTENNLTAVLVAALFAVQPLHAESVSWITERKDMLYGLFFMISLYFYVLKKKNSGRDYDFYIMAGFVLACLSKAAAITFPFVLLIIDYYMDSKITLKDFKEKIILFATSIIFGIINIIAQLDTPVEGTIMEIPTLSILERILVVSHNFIFYIYKTLVPLNLNAFYQYPGFETDQVPFIYYISPLLVIIIAGLVYFSKKYYGNKIIFGFLFYTVTIIPVLQIIPVGRAITADRFAYIPLLGILFILYVLIEDLYSKNIKSPAVKKISVAAIILFIMFSGYLSMQESYKWKNSFTLYTDMIKKDSSNFIGYNNRGTVYFNENKLSEAENDFINAIKYNPEYSQAYNNLGLLENRKKNYEKAIGYFEKAISMNNNFAEAYFNAGNSFFNMNNPDTAIVYYRKAIGIDPGFAAAYNNLGKTLAMKEMYIESINAFKQAIVNDDKYSSAYYNLGLTYLKTRQNEAGINNMITAARLGNSDAINFCNTNNITWQK